MTQPPALPELRRPLGLALAGGGALASWQAGALAEFGRAGLAFDEVLGFSAGALAGAAVVLDNVAEVVRRWREVDDARLLTFAPQRSPLSLFSGEPVWNSIRDTWDDEDAKRRARGALTVVSLDARTRRPEYSRFDAAAGVWDGPLARRLLASCAIPVVFPPVAVGGRSFVDGGVRGSAPLSFSALGACRDVVVLEMVRPEERGARSWSPVWLWEQVSREVVLDLMDEGVTSLLERPDPPRVFRVYPDRALDFVSLDFSSRRCALAVTQGEADGRSFLADPLRRLVREAAPARPAEVPGTLSLRGAYAALAAFLG